MRFNPLIPAVLALLSSGLVAGAEVRFEPGRGDGARVDSEVLRRLEAGESGVPVLVALKDQVEAGSETNSSPLQAAPASRSVRLQARILSGIGDGAFSPRHRFENTSGFSGTLTRAGLEQLRKRTEVASITLDGFVHPAGQTGTAQIGADRLASLGVTGAGRNVAIIDSGIDLNHPDLGGPVPNAKVVGGWNFVDTNHSDLSDCSGHGTEVAGVVAGPQGMAPDAGIVALKVFGGSTCDRAFFSDVLAAVDWAITKRDPLRIDAINISLADERVRSGFCDTEDPAAAALFASARAAGVAVVVAAGNDGKLDGVSWPACFSDVAAVGMVYSASVGPTSWGGMAACQDFFSGADVVPCASNSGSALSFLAPGVRWATPTVGGGRSSSFSGTSAAAPAATGALLLARQARSLLDPALAMDLVRSTGVPVQDGKSGRITSRIDLSAAFDSTSPISGDCSSLAIPDGDSSGVVCEANVTSLVGKVSSVVVALSLDHPDPTQLVVTLTAPDGTSVLLMSRSGIPGHAFREVLGRTSVPFEPLSSFAGRPAAGLWRLRVLDTVPGGSGRIVSWALQIEPEAPRQESGPMIRTATIPVAVHVSGRFGSFFTSDIRLFNADSQKPHDVSLRFRPSQGDEPRPDRSVTLTIPPLGTRVLRDVLGNAFRTADYGPVYIDAPPQVIAGSRTQASAVRGGSYGLYVPAVAPERAVALGSAPLILIPAFRTEGYRVNVSVTEMAGAEVTYEVAVKDSRGASKGFATARVLPFALVQLNDVYQSIGAQPDESDRFEVRVIAGTGRIYAFATAVDNRTNDGFFVSGATPISDLLLPAVSNAPGLYGALFRTDMKLCNTSATPIRIKVSYFPTIGPGYSPVIVPLGVGETRLFSDVLSIFFSPTEPAAGALRLTVLNGEKVVASSRTYTDSGSGSYGLSIDPLAGTGEATPGRKLALTFMTNSADVRTNVGFLETSGIATTGRISVYGSDGARLASAELSFGPLQAVQWTDIFALMSIAPRGDASAIVEVLSGGSLISHVIQIDNRTNDASLIPGTLLP